MQDACAVCGKNLSKSGDPIVYRGNEEPVYVCSPGCGRTLRVTDSIDRLADVMGSLDRD